VTCEIGIARSFDDLLMVFAIRAAVYMAGGERLSARGGRMASRAWMARRRAVARTEPAGVKVAQKSQEILSPVRG
jgi:Tfp pilus assembly protein FimT